MKEDRTELTDIEDRRKAITNIDKNMAVEAGAGTGKTSVLIDRFLTLIKKGTPIEHIAAITFTVKAAREMAWRVREKLDEELSKPEVNEIEKNYILKALLEFNKANIQTIHSFALDIIRERPFEAGIDPNLQIGEIERDDQEELFKKWLLSLSDSEKNILAQSVKFGVNIENLISIANQLTDAKDLIPYIEDIKDDEPNVIPDIVNKFNQLDTIIRKQFIGDEDDLLYKGFLELKNDIEQMNRDRNILFNTYEKNYKTSKGKVVNWINIEDIRATIKDFTTYKDSQIERLLYWLAHKILNSVKNYINIIYQLKIEKSTFEFDDILIEARNLLRDNKDVREYFRQKYRYLLIDEFQDTDPLQVEIAYLIAGGGTETDWQKANLKDGSIFIVGDPKQSIYHFRRADLMIYKLAEEIIQKSGDKIALRQNFRSTKGIIDWVNNTFKDIIGNSEDKTIDPEYIEIQPYHTDDSYISNAPINFIIPRIEEGIEYAADARRLEARYISATIDKIINDRWQIRAKDIVRNVTYGDIAILYFTNINNDIYENALNNYNIQYSFIKPSNILEQNPEIIYLKYILDALRNPYDEYAIICALKSPFFALSDEEISEYYLKYGKPNIIMKPDGDGPIFEALKMLYELFYSYKDKHIYELIYEIIKKSNLLLRTPVIKRERFLKSIFDLIESIALDNSTDPTFTVRDFSNNIDYLLNDGEKKTINIFDPNEDAVKLMTIYQAKGLEFPVVILSKLCSGEQRGADNIIKDFIGRRLAISFSKKLRNNYYDELREKEDLINTAENKRLLYVACTRAKDYLIIPLFYCKTNYDQGYYRYFDDKLPKVNEIYENNLIGKVKDECYYIDPTKLNLKEREDFVNIKNILETKSTTNGYKKEREEKEEEMRSIIESSELKIMKITNITEFADTKEPFKTVEEPKYGYKDKGLIIGDNVHKVMEVVDFNETNLKEIVDVICGHENDSVKEKIEGLVKKLLNLPLIKRALEIGRFSREVPVSYLLNDEIITGKIDLLVIEDDGLIIADYKTDSVNEIEWKKRLEKYTIQLNYYKDAIETTTGKKVLGLYILNPKYGEIGIGPR